MESELYIFRLQSVPKAKSKDLTIHELLNPKGKSLIHWCTKLILKEDEFILRTMHCHALTYYTYKFPFTLSVLCLRVLG